MDTKTKKRKYNHKIYGFDIETTTLEHITVHYLSSFISVDFEVRSGKTDDIINSMSKTVFCRTSDDINDYLIKLDSSLNGTGETVIIYSHNLAYEFDYLIKNIPFIRENFDNKEALFIKPRIPLFFRVNNIEFRCSYRFLNKSLRELGIIHNYNKLDIDYQSLYFPFSKLPSVEYDYNERDVRLMLLSVLLECNQWKFINTVNDIPLTITGLTRKNNEYINSLADRRNYSGMCNYQRFFTKEYIEFLESTFQGGYTHANALYVNKPLENVVSFDIVSSYIDTILHRNYPHFFREYYGKYKLRYFKHLASLNTLNYQEVINNYREPFKVSFMATITIKNVQAKNLNGNLILPISASKCSYLENITLDNGRIYKTYLLKLNVTEVDYFIIKQFYKFTVVNCEKLYYTTYHRELANYVLKSTKEYLHEKSTLKNVLSRLSSGRKLRLKDFYNENKAEYIYPESDIENILKAPKSEQKTILNNNYMVAKGKLNAQYGINVQKLLNPVIEYDKVNDIFVNDTELGVTSRVLYRDFTKGLYITAYSRLNLFCFGLYLIHNTNTKLIYSDTDSWKCYGDIENAIKTQQRYNAEIEKIVNNSNDYNIGYFDYECCYSYYSTLGCKKYIYADGQKIVTTIAGVNKKKTSAAYTELYKSLNYDFELLCSVAFNPCTILSYTLTDKLITKYNVGPYNELVTDCNGDRGYISGYNMVELEHSDYLLMDYDKGIINEYINYFSTLQGLTPDIIPTYVYRDTDGNVKYKYITNWSESIHILRGDNVDFINLLNGGLTI